jgi:hypothetical protein
MASNYRKSFNFKNGVQVDTDNFIVAGSMVGIGTTIPRQFLDVYGNDSGAVQVQGQVKVSGLTTTAKLYAGIGTIDNLTGTASSIGIGTFDLLQVGNSPTVNNLIGYAYTAWITDDGGIGLRTDSSVGIGTTTSANYALLIGSLPTVAGASGIGFTDGDIRATGIITAPTFVGSLTGVAASATILETSRTFEITGDLEGAAISFNGSDNVSIASTLSSSFNAETTGIITAATLSGVLTASSGYIGTATVKDLTQVTGGIATFLNIDGTYADFEKVDIGIGTAQEFTVKDDDTNTTLRVNNDSTSIISIGKSEPQGNQSAEIKYNDADTTLQIANYDIGGVDVLLHQGTGAGTTSGFKVKYENVIASHTTYDGRVSIGKNDPDTGYRLDVNGLSQTQGLKVVGIITLTSLNGQSEYTLDPTNPLQLAGDNFDIATGVSTLNTLRVIGTITQENPVLDGVNGPYTSGKLDLGYSKYGNAVIGIGTTSTTIGFLLDDPNDDKYKVSFTRSNIVVDGITTTTKIVADDAYLNMDVVGGGATHFSGNIDNTYNSRSTKLGITTVTKAFIVGNIPENPHPHGDFGPDVKLGITTTIVDSIGAVVTLAVTGTGSGYTNGTHTETATTSNGNGTGLTVTLTVASGTFSEVAVVGAGQNYQVGDVITIPAAGGGTGLTVTVNEIDGQLENVLFVKGGTYIGIGTTNVDEFHTPGYNGVIKDTNFIFDRNTVTTTTGLLMIRRSEFQTDLSASGKLAIERDPVDPRGSSAGRATNDASFFSYGENLDIDTKTSTMVFDGSLSIVPVPGKRKDGTVVNSADAWSGGIHPDYTGRQNDPNTGDFNNSRLTMVGINTYIPRCLLDLGASSPSMNSYMILPTLDQTSINIVQGLWANSGNQGHDNAQRLTPNGVPQGAILYNSTTDNVQVRNTANSFRNLNPIVAFGRVENGTLQTGSFNVSTYTNPGGTRTRITFDNALPNANYTVIYNNENDGTNQTNISNAISAQQTGYFEITWGSLTNLNWFFSVLQV